MKFVIAALLAGSAAAFAPSTLKTSGTALKAFENELGAQPPLGLFDPLGLLNNADQGRFDRLRYVEIKHGRIAQLAFLGQIVTRYGIHFDGNFGDVPISSIPPGAAAFDVLPKEGLYQIIAFIGFLEVFVMKDVTGEGEFPGDFRNGFIDFGWDSFSEEQKLQKRAVELNNGRAAMMGILGLMMHEQIGGTFPIIGQM